MTKPGLISPSVRALKGEKGKDCEVHVPWGISVLGDDGKQIGKTFQFFFNVSGRYCHIY